MTVNLQTGTAERHGLDQLFSESDSYPSAIALCPKSDMMYFSGLGNEDLCCYDLLQKKFVKTIQGN